MNNDKQFIGDVEPMIDARQSAVALRLPYYWFADPKMRAKYRIPHYLLGGLVRFRLSEIEVWYRQNGRVDEANRPGAEGGDD